MPGKWETNKQTKIWVKILLGLYFTEIYEQSIKYKKENVKINSRKKDTVINNKPKSKRRSPKTQVY